MDTINNITSAAGKALWGDGAKASGEEPVSGQKGAGTTDEPYDKGNAEDTTGSSGNADPSVNNPPTSGVDTSSNRDGPTDATTDSSAGDPKSAQSTEQKQQGADRPEDAPGPKDTDAIKDSKDKAETSASKDGPKVPHTDEEREEAMAKGEFPHDPNDHSGEPLTVHDGSEKKERTESVSHEGGGTMGGPEKGQGTEVVRASGVAADGGDFDATNPGAGSEATRLLEEKGVHKTKPDEVSDTTKESHSPSPSDKAGKPSKLAKLKEKLHIGKSNSSTAAKE